MNEGAMITVSLAEGYRLWSSSYDADLNPLTALEQRVLEERIRIAPGSAVLDLATGTGRWLEFAVLKGARAIGVDLSFAMLAAGSRKDRIRGRLAVADVCRLPVRDGAFDLAICSFALGYIPDGNVFHEMARVARRVIVSDVHPEAIEAGWNRSFRIGSQKFGIVHHHRSVASIAAGARAAGLAAEWIIDARFGEPERIIFERAGKGGAFAAAQKVKAVLISSWVASWKALRL